MRKKIKRVKIVRVDMDMCDTQEAIEYYSQFIGLEYTVLQEQGALVYLPIASVREGGEDFTIWDMSEIEVLEWEE